MRGMGNRHPLWPLVALAIAVAAPAHAQYDRDGRYIPSPNGIPQDPYARPVPGYTGNPNVVPRGEPIWPRGMTPIPPKVERPAERLEPTRPLGSRQRLTLDLCARGWKPATGWAKNEFARRCALLRKDAPTS